MDDKKNHFKEEKIKTKSISESGKRILQIDYN